MPQINLLPWRSENLKRRKQICLLSVATITVGMLIVTLVIHLVLQRIVFHSENKNLLLTKHIRKINETISRINHIELQKKNLVEQIEAIHKLQQYQSHIIYFFSAMVRSVPPGVLLTDIKNTRDSISITGKADANDSIALLMRNLMLNRLGSPVLSEIKTISNEQQYTLEFVLVLNPEWSGKC